jgi:hypothetical protein
LTDGTIDIIVVPLACFQRGGAESPPNLLMSEEDRMTANGRTRHRNGTKSEVPLGSLYNLGEDVKDSFEADIERAIEQSIARAKFTTSSAANIEVRHEGFLHLRENAEDRKRKNALKANRDRGTLTAHHLKLIGDFAANGQQYVLDVVEHLTEDIAHRSPTVQPIAESLTRASAKIVAAAYTESLQFLAERGSQEVDQATLPGQDQQ